MRRTQEVLIVAALKAMEHHEREFLRKCTSPLMSQYESVRRQVERGTQASALILDIKPVRDIANALLAMLIDVYGLGTTMAATEIRDAAKTRKFAAVRNLPFPADASAFYPEGGLEWYRDYSLRIVGGNQVDLLERAKGAIAAGVRDGLAQRDVMKRLEEVYTQFGRHRLENIARTETAKIYEQARYQEFDSTEEVVGYEIVAISDSRTTDICRARNGKIIPKDQIEGNLPPYHFRCRTTIVPIFAWEIESGAVEWNPIAPHAPKPLDGFGSTSMKIPVVKDRATRKLVAKAGEKARAKTKPAKPKGTPAGQFASIEEAGAHFRDAHGVAALDFEGSRMWGREFKSEAKRLQHLGTVSKEWDRLHERYPGLPKRAVHTFRCVDSSRGKATRYAPKPEISTKGHEFTDEVWGNIGKWEQRKGRRWSSERRGHQVADNFRHEFAHAMTTRADEEAWREMRRRVTMHMPDAVSEYAGKDVREAVAESFGIYTREDYVPGTLPPAIEAVLKERFGL